MVVVTTGIVVSTDYETVVLDLECCHSVPPLPQDGMRILCLRYHTNKNKARARWWRIPVLNCGQYLHFEIPIHTMEGAKAVKQRATNNKDMWSWSVVARYRLLHLYLTDKKQ